MTDEPKPTSVPAPMPEEVPTVVEAPYRTALEAAPAFVARASPAVTVWGPVLWTFGIVLWSYVVIGQLVTTYAPGRHSLLLGEGTGILFVLVASFVAWIVGLRRSLHASPAAAWGGRLARGVVLGMLASMSWCTVTVGASIAGQAGSKNADGTVTVFLLVVSIAALLYGRRLSPPVDASPTQRRRTLARLAWTGAAVLTLIALVALAASD